MKLWDFVVEATGIKGPPKGPAPKCKKCGHRPCPGCVDWCDTMMWNIYCPECDEIVCELKGQKSGEKMICPHCAHPWSLRVPGGEGSGDDIGVDPCCDHECDWDLPMAEVEAWCDQYKR